LWFASRAIFCLYFDIVEVIGRRNQVVFARRDAIVNDAGLVDFIVEPHFFQYVFDETFRIGRIVDGEVTWVVDALAFDAQNAGENGVEGAHPDVARFVITYQFTDTHFHFFRRFVGESQRENLKGINALVNEMCDAICKHACFA